MAQFAVIGLGSFGATVALELTKLNHDVIGIDTIKRNVESLADRITHAVIADATDEHVLEELNIQNCDAVVVAIGEDIEASILCVLNLKNLGVEPLEKDFTFEKFNEIISKYKTNIKRYIENYEYVPVNNSMLAKAEIPFLIFERNRGKCFIEMY